MSRIKNKISDIWDGIHDGISDKIGDIRTTIENGLNGAIDWIRGLASDAWNWGSDIIWGIIDGIQSAIGWLEDCVTNVADTIRDFLHFSVPDKGPLTDYESWMPDFMQGLANGINKSKKLVTQAAAAVADGISVSMQGNLQMDALKSEQGSVGATTTVINNDNSRTINQTNNSPKALTRLEIYRQTRNAINV